MIKFGLGSTEIEFHGFAKHHKRMPIHIGRFTEDGVYTNLITSDAFQKDVDENPSKVFYKERNIYNSTSRAIEKVKDAFVWLENLEYKDGTTNYYSIGAVNTEQTMYIRLKFQFEHSEAYLDYKMTTSGQYASSFKDLVGGSFIRDIIEEIVDECRPIEEAGIDVSENGYYEMILVVDGEPIECEMPLHEIEQGFIGIEVYKFEQKII